MTHRDRYGNSTGGGGCGTIIFALVIAAIALAALTKGSLW